VREVGKLNVRGWSRRPDFLDNGTGSHGQIPVPGVSDIIPPLFIGHEVLAYSFGFLISE
jgi:hypothetical protein